MTPWQWFWLACLPAGVLLFGLGVIGFDVVATLHKTPTLSHAIATFGEKHPAAVATISAAWFGLGCLMIGHWWWPVD